MNSANKFLYYLNYTDYLKNICDLEMKAIFGFIPIDKYFTTSTFIHPSRSIFIKGCLTISYLENSLEELSQAVKEDHLIYDGYKIGYIKSSDDLSYVERLKALRVMGFSIEGDFALQNPKINLVLTKFNQQWVFGHYVRNDGSWKGRKQKPFNYSYSLDNILAKTLVNIAIGNNFDLKVVDPCCGIGTVLIEGRYMEVDIKGFDINPNVVEKCNKNLQFFGFVDDVEMRNIHDINECYDAAIVDLPYGQFSKTSLEEQIFIISETKKLAKRAIFVTMEDMNAIIDSCGFTIVENCIIQKRDHFSRWITICGS